MLEDKAKELGRMLGQSSEYQNVKRSTDALNGDAACVALLKRMDELRSDAAKMIDRGEQPSEEMERELDELLGKVQVNPLYQRAAVAQENFDKTMYQVNAWILDGMRKGGTSSIITLS